MNRNIINDVSATNLVTQNLQYSAIPTVYSVAPNGSIMTNDGNDNSSQAKWTKQSYILLDPVAVSAVGCTAGTASLSANVFVQPVFMDVEISTVASAGGAAYIDVTIPPGAIPDLEITSPNSLRGTFVCSRSANSFLSGRVFSPSSNVLRFEFGVVPTFAGGTLNAQIFYQRS